MPLVVTKKSKESPNMTPRGKGLVGMAFVMIVIGSMVGESLIVQLGVFAGIVLFFAYYLAKQNVKKIRILRRIPRTVFSGHDFNFELEITNKKRLMNSRNIMIYDHYLPFSEKGLACDLIRTGQSLAEDFRTRVVGRGTVNGKGYRIESDFPLGLFNVVKRRRGKEVMQVYPRPMLTAAIKSTVTSGGEGNSLMSFMYNNDGEICGSREFQKGDKINQVIWPAYARTGRLYVRDYDYSMPQKYSLVFHSYSPSGKLIWPEVFEHAISLVTGLILMCRDQGIPFEICGPFTGWEMIEIKNPLFISEVLSYLAQAQHCPNSDLEVVSKVLMSLPGTHPVFVISEASVDTWADKLPQLPRVINCVDNDVLKSKKPKLKDFRSVA
ncbi:MAG: DUF58 domain-containing protein [Verrucomicrobiota bacterium]|nr:DUF58 domain-containing protein [Verrucomicrobiota bacterium]